MLQTNGMKFFRSLTAALVASSLLLTPSLTLQAQSALPNLGDDTSMTLGAERRLGDQIGREIYRDAEYVSDPVLDAYVGSIWQPLLAEAKRSGAMPFEMDTQFAWQAFLVRDKSVNAFALPGGYFGVHLGLIALSETPDALASVLAHETTHVTQRHISRGMSKEGAGVPWLVASMLVGLLAMRTNPQMASAAMATGQAASIQGQLNFSRDFEREADRIGFTLMQPAGYSPNGFVDMFEMLGKASRLSDSGNFPYLRTHPLTTERVADMRARVGEFERNKESSTSPSLDSNRLLLHRLMAARAGVLADLSVDAQKFYLQQGDAALPTEAKFAATQYAAALAAWQTKDAARARRFYERLRASTSMKTPPAALQAVRWLGAELQVPTTLDLASQNRVEMLYAVNQTMLTSGVSAAELGNVTSRLQDWLSIHPKDADAWSWLSRVQLAQNKPVRSAIARAEAMRAQLDDSAALAQYQAAQSLIRSGVQTDSIDAAIVDSKVRELQQRVRENNVQKKL
jgi:beta-barrel assembly-enhancing protease